MYIIQLFDVLCTYWFAKSPEPYCQLGLALRALQQVIPLRNYLLGYEPPSERKPDPVLATIADLVRKMYNPRNFKGCGGPTVGGLNSPVGTKSLQPRVVSPHEYYQAVGRVTQKKWGRPNVLPAVFWSKHKEFGNAQNQVLRQADGSSGILQLAKHPDGSQMGSFDPQTLYESR